MDHMGLRQLVVPPGLWPLMCAMLGKIDSVPVYLPPDDPESDDLPTYVIQPSPEAFQRLVSEALPE